MLRKREVAASTDDARWRVIERAIGEGCDVEDPGSTGRQARDVCVWRNTPSWHREGGKQGKDIAAPGSLCRSLRGEEVAIRNPGR